MTTEASSCEGTASGKVILFGEHAVVYAVPGIAAGIDRGARAKATRAASGERSSLLMSGRTLTPDEDSDHARAFRALLTVEPSCMGVHVEASADVPPGGGLGCSAALGVAIARAVESATFGDTPDEARVLERALAWERVFHGNPSGIDTAAAIAGTFLLYERGAGTKPLTPPYDVWLAVGYSGASASTKQMVEGIARIKDRNPDLFDKFLSGVRAIVENARLALEAGDGRALGQLMDMNQMLLAGVLLSTEAIEKMCAIARSTGALGAKLTGSGGGGSVIALGGICPRGERRSAAEELAVRIAAAWSDAGFAAFPTRIHGSHNDGATSLESPGQ
ncbi:MAG: mevalonate kinase [Polyangiaceae bacterium]|nr:mevalonate kinase [Polyangiaceae bacterium]